MSTHTTPLPEESPERSGSTWTYRKALIGRRLMKAISRIIVTLRSVTR